MDIEIVEVRIEADKALAWKMLDGYFSRHGANAAIFFHFLEHLLINFVRSVAARLWDELAIIRDERIVLVKRTLIFRTVNFRIEQFWIKIFVLFLHDFAIFVVTWLVVFGFFWWHARKVQRWLFLRQHYLRFTLDHARVLSLAGTQHQFRLQLAVVKSFNTRDSIIHNAWQPVLGVRCFFVWKPLVDAVRVSACTTQDFWKIFTLLWRL